MSFQFRVLKRISLGGERCYEPGDLVMLESQPLEAGFFEPCDEPQPLEAFGQGGELEAATDPVTPPGEPVAPAAPVEPVAPVAPVEPAPAVALAPAVANWGEPKTGKK